MSSDVLGFFRKGGKVIPIRAASSAARAASHGSKAAHVVKAVARAGIVAKGVHSIRKSGLKSKEIKVNRALDMTGLGLSVAAGIVAASTFSGGWKSIAAGAVASHAVDAAGIAANVGSVAGKGKLKARAEQGAKQEARNFIVGNAVWGAGLLASSQNRKALVGYTKTILKFARKAVGVAE